MSQRFLERSRKLRKESKRGNENPKTGDIMIWDNAVKDWVLTSYTPNNHESPQKQIDDLNKKLNKLMDLLYI
jgi:hypothetical protein